MAELLSIQELKKSSASRAILEQYASKVVFCPDSEIRKAIVYQLYSQEGEMSIPSEILVKSLSCFYRSQSLEFGKGLWEDDYFLIRAGAFQGRKAAVKILKATTKEITHDTLANPKYRQSIIMEAKNLRRLNKNPHRNIPRLLAYNTERLPYHIITSFQPGGNLLEVLRKARLDGSLPPPTLLLKMCIDITGALMHLAKHDMVHRAVRAQNVLVEKDGTCKLSYLESARHLVSDDSASVYSYCSSEDASPEFISEDPDEELAVRWAAPECLGCPRRFTTASDVWALAVTMYEIFTIGCEPYARTHGGQLVEDKDVKEYVSNCIGLMGFLIKYEQYLRKAFDETEALDKIYLGYLLVDHSPIILEVCIFSLYLKCI